MVSYEESIAKVDAELAEMALSHVRALSPVRSIGGLSPRLTRKDVSLASGVAAMMVLAEKNGVKLASVSSPLANGMEAGKPVGDLFTPVPMAGNGLLKTDLDIKANYQDYDGFRKFFAGLAEAGASVQRVSVKRSLFEATVRFYGV